MTTYRWLTVAVLAAILIAGWTSQARANTAQVTLNPARCLALTMYWEAKGEGRDGMLAVAAVVLNRVAHPEFPDDVCGVAYEGGSTPPCQFSWYCNGRDNLPVEPGPWALAQELANEVLRKPPSDPTGGALFFHAARIDTPWARPRTRTARIGEHIYYR